MPVGLDKGFHKRWFHSHDKKCRNTFIDAFKHTCGLSDGGYNNFMLKSPRNVDACVLQTGWPNAMPIDSCSRHWIPSKVASSDSRTIHMLLITTAFTDWLKIITLAGCTFTNVHFVSNSEDTLQHQEVGVKPVTWRHMPYLTLICFAASRS